MKSRDEIVIIMLQWMRLYTLGSRGSRELKTFLETRLISSQVDQKLSFKGRIHRFLKGKLARGSWPIEAVVVADSWLRGSGSLGRCHGFNSPVNRLEFCFKNTQDRDAIVARSRHDHGLIVRRLCVDRAADPQENTA